MLTRIAVTIIFFWLTKGNVTTPSEYSGTLY